MVKVLQSHGAEMAERAGCRLAFGRVVDADLTRPRDGIDLARLPLGSDANQAIDDPSVQIVIELIGGLEPARTFILRALAAGKHVVTANKALLAHHGTELFEEARRRGVMLGFEAAVAGGIPLIRAVKDGLPANRILSTFGIVNGTCNYILSKMTDEGRDFGEVLKEAQAHGYAESDPTLDIEGMDSAHKLQILATLAFRTAVDLKDIYTEGITAVTQQDVVNATELGYRIKLLAIAKASDGALEARVHPTMIPAGSPMAAVSGVFNAVFMTGDNVGNLMFYGRGAGQLPTASAVWSDALDIARRVAHGIPALDIDLPSVGRNPAAAPAHGRHPLGLLPARDGARPARRARPGGGHPRAARHLARLRAPEGARAHRGGAGGHDDARGAGAGHARRARRHRQAAGGGRAHHDDPGGGMTAGAREL